MLPLESRRKVIEAHLEGEGPAVNKVAVEEVRVLLGGHAVEVKYMEQVVVLAVRVAADGDARVHRDVDVHQRLLYLDQALELYRDNSTRCQ